MSLTTVSFRIEETKKAELDVLASALNRDRTFMINEAIDALLEVQKWHIREIKEGIAEADAGQFADEQDVQAVFSKWT